VTKTKLSLYFYEADKHIKKITNSKRVLKRFYPFTIDKLKRLNDIENDKLDVLAFRFAKLQDLLGEKVFRNLLNLMGYNTQKPFIEILSELEREGLIDIKKWIALRDARNLISHEYPYQEDKVIEAINFIFENSDYLIEVTKRLKRIFDEINKKRG
jgi:hypothetical protein